MGRLHLFLLHSPAFAFAACQDRGRSGRVSLAKKGCRCSRIPPATGTPLLAAASTGAPIFSFLFFVKWLSRSLSPLFRFRFLSLPFLLRRSQKLRQEEDQRQKTEVAQDAPFSVFRSSSALVVKKRGSVSTTRGASCHKTLWI